MPFLCFVIFSYFSWCSSLCCLSLSILRLGVYPNPRSKRNSGMLWRPEDPIALSFCRVPRIIFSSGCVECNKFIVSCSLAAAWVFQTSQISHVAHCGAFHPRTKATDPWPATITWRSLLCLSNLSAAAYDRGDVQYSTCIRIPLSPCAVSCEKICAAFLLLLFLGQLLKAGCFHSFSCYYCPCRICCYFAECGARWLLRDE